MATQEKVKSFIEILFFFAIKENEGLKLLYIFPTKACKSRTSVHMLRGGKGKKKLTIDIKSTF